MLEVNSNYKSIRGKNVKPIFFPDKFANRMTYLINGSIMLSEVKKKSLGGYVKRVENSASEGFSENFL